MIGTVKSGFPTVRPADDVASPQVLRSQPILERPEVLPERGRVQSVLADGFSKRLLPRRRRAPLHDSPTADKKTPSCTFFILLSNPDRGQPWKKERGKRETRRAPPPPYSNQGEGGLIRARC